MLTDKESRIETEIRELSLNKFHWQTNGLIDKLDELFDDDFIYVHTNGYISPKYQWIGELRSSRFVYHTIDVKETSVKVYENTAVVVGKADFKVSIKGSKVNFRLTYTEVYAIKNGNWKLVNLHNCSR